MISRKHFKALAEILKEHNASDKLIADVSNWLQSENPRFDKVRFYQAAKSSDEEEQKKAG